MVRVPSPTTAWAAIKEEQLGAHGQYQNNNESGCRNHVVAGAVAGGLVGLDTNDRVARSFYATTDERGLAINRFATSAGQGVTLDQLLRMPHFARWRSDGGQCDGVLPQLYDRLK